ncbi:pickpocket protein 28-like [Hermetia illucens]|uniref:pickpocket protein 28-like n=1 Tax=Hermetia illucens TaxID=343691 RepID=UPI0018CC090E|nr:pickpocket protein 28-like [Hermetia illucens]
MKLARPVPVDQERYPDMVTDFVMPIVCDNVLNCGPDVVKRNIEEHFDDAQPTFYENTSAFAKNSSLHGLRFVGDDRLSLYERGFFFVSFLIAVLFSCNFIYEVYMEWVATPVIIGINPDLTYINEIPFPAITICNMNQALAGKVQNIKNGSTEFAMLRLLCGRKPPINSKNVTKDWLLFQKFIVDVAQPCSKMLVSCRYGSDEMNCSHLFRTVVTDEGLCCAFNLIDTKFMYKNANMIDHFAAFNPPNITAVDWSPEEGYEPNLPPNFYPRSAAGVGKSMGLSLVLDAQVDEYYCSSTNGVGFKALLHNPAEIPDIANYGISLQVGHEVGVTITPDIADASYLLRNMERKYRQCMFSNEAQLNYYATYTRRNCEMECEAKLHRERCDCVQYYMPHIEPNANVCGLSDMKCSDSVRYKTHKTSEELYQCSEECIPACFELGFSTNIYSSRLSHKQFLISDKPIQSMSEQYAEDNIVAVHFYYTERAFRSHTKQQFVGFTEFLSDTGGLMGLFLGFSVLSIVEIIYYILIRPYFATQRYNASVKYKRLVSNRQTGLPPTYQANLQYVARRYKRTIGFGKTLSK